MKKTILLGLSLFFCDAAAQITILKNDCKAGRSIIVLLNDSPYMIDSIRIEHEGGEILTGGIKGNDVKLISRPGGCLTILKIEFWPKKED